MKKIILSMLVVMIMGLGSLKAQNCAEIVQPYLTLHHYDPNNYPEVKVEWRCLFSHSAFYVCDTVPQGATVISISEVQSLLNGERISSNYVVDLEHLSYWEYNFNHFQHYTDSETVYFETPASTSRYLALRCYRDTKRRADHPERYIK